LIIREKSRARVVAPLVYCIRKDAMFARRVGIQNVDRF